MAHELGHGVHASLARPSRDLRVRRRRSPSPRRRRSSASESSWAAARRRAPTTRKKLSLIGDSLDGAVGAVFRQVAMNRFEDRVHHERRLDAASSRSTTSPSAWIDTQTEMLGDSVEISRRLQLVVVLRAALHRRRRATCTPTRSATCSRCRSTAATRRSGEGFADSYLDLLRAGGSMPPEELGEIVGVDLTDPGFWNAGIDLIERQLDDGRGDRGRVSLGRGRRRAAR